MRVSRNVMRRGFTLIEMLIVLAIIAILAALTYGALFQAQHTAREAKTKATIAKLHSLMMTRWESFHHRRLAINQTGVTNLKTLAERRLDCLRELQRLELPQRHNDIITLPNTSLFPMGWDSSLRQAYLRKMPTSNGIYDSAECLYLILTTSSGDESLTGQELNNVDVGDIDGDGHKEFHDGWGQPINFIRWAPGFISDLQPRDGSGNPDVVNHHDPFDVRKVDPNAFALFPLIYSAGPDGIEDIVHQTGPLTFDPYSMGNMVVGRQEDRASGPSGSIPANGQLDSFDNIHNHLLSVRQ